MKIDYHKIPVYHFYMQLIYQSCNFYLIVESANFFYKLCTIDWVIAVIFMLIKPEFYLSL